MGEQSEKKKYLQIVWNIQLREIGWSCTAEATSTSEWVFTNES